MPVENLRNKIAETKQLLDSIPFMNDARKQKLLWLLECMEDVILEEEVTRAFFKDIRGGRAV